jgi:hypothetical protein
MVYPMHAIELCGRLSVQGAESFMRGGIVSSAQYGTRVLSFGKENQQ